MIVLANPLLKGQHCRDMESKILNYLYEQLFWITVIEFSFLALYVLLLSLFTESNN